MAVLVSAAVAYSSGCASAPAEPILARTPTSAPESPCPQGPFESDPNKIRIAIESLPRVSTKPTRESRSSSEPSAWALTNGVFSAGGGGLPSPYKPGDTVGVYGRVEYDATRYFARYVRTVATYLGNGIGDYRYYTSTVRLTVEQARYIACTVNQLLQPLGAPANEEAVELQAMPKEIVVTAQKRCDIEYTDGHEESLLVWVGGTPAAFSKALSCGDIAKLGGLLSSAVGAAFSN